MAGNVGALAGQQFNGLTCEEIAHNASVIHYHIYNPEELCPQFVWGNRFFKLPLFQRTIFRIVDWITSGSQTQRVNALVQRTLSAMSAQMAPDDRFAAKWDISNDREVVLYRAIAQRVLNDVPLYETRDEAIKVLGSFNQMKIWTGVNREDVCAQIVLRNFPLDPTTPTLDGQPDLDHVVASSQDRDRTTTMLANLRAQGAV